MTGIVISYSSLATIAPNTKNLSTPVVINAAGEVPPRTDSRNTAVVVLEPRVYGIARILFEAFFPESECRRSMISPVAGSYPPQKLSDSLLTNNRPFAVPVTKGVPRMITMAALHSKHRLLQFEYTFPSYQNAPDEIAVLACNKHIFLN